MAFTTLFFDLDDTVYANTTGLWPAIRARMGKFMHERLGLAEAEVPALRRSYFETYGTTLRGLQIHHQVDADEYLAYVHDLPLEDYIGPDEALRNLLLSLPEQKWIFTNADADHARRVLKILQVGDCFSGIVDLRATGFACKPEPEAYRLALELAGEQDARRCVMLDDSPSNLASARAMGLFTILVGARDPNPSADRAVESLSELPNAVPELWRDGDRTGDLRESG